LPKYAAALHRKHGFNTALPADPATPQLEQQVSDGEGSVAAEEAQSTSIHFFFGVPLLGGPLKPEHCLGMIFLYS